VWLEGIDLDRLKRLRQLGHDSYDAVAVRSAEHVASRFRVQRTGVLKLQEALDEAVAQSSSISGEVIAYLATLGLFLLICTKPEADD